MNIPTTDLSGKVAIVTGATKGIGYGIAWGLSQAGADVVVVSRNQEDCDRVARSIRERGRKTLAQSANLGNLPSIDLLMEKVVGEFGRVDILVNNAAISLTKPSAELSVEDWDSVIDTNLKGVFFTCQKAGRQMMKQGSGKIVNISSVFGFISDPCLLPYCVSKGGLTQLTRQLAVEWARHNIQVNAVAPGYVKTELNASFLEKEEIYQRTIRKIPMRRLAGIEEIAGSVVFLSSDAASYITGTTLVVDGGWLAQ